MLGEITDSAREGLLALAIVTGLQVISAWMNASSGMPASCTRAVKI